MDTVADSTDATEALGRGYRPVSFEALAKLHEAGQPTEVAVRAPVQISDLEIKGETVTFVSTTGAVDRDRDIIRPRGVDVTAWELNSIVLFQHDVRQRIAVGETRLTARGDKWLTTADYFPSDISPLAVSLRKMIEFRIARARRLKTKDKGAAFSIGFIPLKTSFVAERGGFDIEKSEKLEDSDVSLASNRDALIAREAFADGVAIDGLFDWAEGVRREAGIAGVNAAVGQKLIELIDPPKGLKLIELTPGHLKHLRYDPPAEPEASAEPNETTGQPGANEVDPAALAYRCASLGISADATRAIFGDAGLSEFADGIADCEAKKEPPASPPESANEPVWDDSDLILKEGEAAPAKTAEDALSAEELDSLLIVKQAALTGNLPH